jgi:hypothetical protein
MSDTITLNKLSVGFGSICEQTETNTFTITGDITIQATDGTFKLNISVDKLKVVYNHDGLLEHAIQSEHTDLDVLYDAEHYFVEQELDWNAVTHKDYKLATDGNAIELYADFEIYSDDMY